MNRYQKIAWFNLIVIAATIIVTATAIAVEFHMRGYSAIGPFFAGILVLLKLTPHLFKKPQSRSEVVSDERDDLILTRAVSYAWTAFWWVFIGPKNSVPTIALPLMALGGGLFVKTACSVAILIQYGRGGDDHE
jgi:hypothetical protein